MCVSAPGRRAAPLIKVVWGAAAGHGKRTHETLCADAKFGVRDLSRPAL